MTNFLTKLAKPDCPEFAEFRKVKRRIAEHHENQRAIGALIEKAEAGQKAALNAYLHAPSVESFEALSEALGACQALTNARAYPGLSSSASYALLVQSDEVIEALYAALKVFRQRLADEIARLAGREAEFLSESGLTSTGENPALAPLRETLGKLAEAIVFIEDRKQLGDVRDQNVWQRFAQLVPIE